MTAQKTCFISDLHLDESQPHLIQFFLKFLNQCDKTVDALYILGDLFEVWIGDDVHSLFSEEMIEALRTKTKNGLPIFFLPGNRDFLIGKKFLTASGCQLLPDEKKIWLYHTPVLLMHGDTLCTRDIHYLKWRKLSHHPLSRYFFLCWPLSWRQALANQLRKKSKAYTQKLNSDLMDVTQSEVERVMSHHQANVLIHGHTHRPGIHPFSLNGKAAERIVLGAWHDHPNVLVWKENGEKELLLMTDSAAIT